MCLATPIALIIFNRPEHTKQVFEQIRQARPQHLFVIADGPRADHPEDRETCAAARAVTDNVDWSCNVRRNYSETNLGCGRRPATGITWVFDQVEEAIILEDDCVPHPTFFSYCQELLERYRDDRRIMAISGDNFQFGRSRTQCSYYFSIFPHCTGWASWRRAWQHFDYEMELLPDVIARGYLRGILPNDTAVFAWTEKFADVYRTKDPHIWDYQWTFACWAQGGLAVLPNVNLIRNIGYGPGATHTFDGTCNTANLPVEPMKFPLIHPEQIMANYEADLFTLKNNFRQPLTCKIRQSFRRIVWKLTGAGSRLSKPMPEG